MVECKWGSAEISPGLCYLRQRFAGVPAWQISAVGTKAYETPGGIRVAPACRLLCRLI